MENERRQEDVIERLVKVETTQTLMREDFRDHEMHDNDRFRQINEKLDTYHGQVSKKFELMHKKIDSVRDDVHQNTKNHAMILGGLIVIATLLPLAFKLLGWD